MEEIVYRRYKRLLDEQKPLPQLILIDGGKGQLSAAVESLKKTGVYEQVAVAGIAKRLEEIYVPNDPYPLHIDKRSPSLRLLQQIRNEAHRFAITFHRQLRSKGTFQSALENIPGIGAKTAQKLLIAFKSMANIQQAAEQDLKKILSSKQIKALQNFFNADAGSSSWPALLPRLWAEIVNCSLSVNLDFGQTHQAPEVDLGAKHLQYVEFWLTI